MLIGLGLAVLVILVLLLALFVQKRKRKRAVYDPTKLNLDIQEQDEPHKGSLEWDHHAEREEARIEDSEVQKSPIVVRKNTLFDLTPTAAQSMEDIRSHATLFEDDLSQQIFDEDVARMEEDLVGMGPAISTQDLRHVASLDI